MASYDNYTDSELRKRLLEIGYDIPISVNRDFLIKKLKSVQESSSKNGGRRKSVARTTAVEKEVSAAADSSSSQLNASGSGGRKSVSSRVKTRHSLALSDITMTGSPKLRANNHQQQQHRDRDRDRRGQEMEMDMDMSSNASSSVNVSRSRVSFNSISTIGDEDDLNLSTSPLTPTSATVGAGLNLRSGNVSSNTGGSGDQSWSKKSTPQDWTRYSSLFPSPISATPPTSFTTTSSSSVSNLNNGSWNNHGASNSNNSHSALNRLAVSKRTSGFSNDVHHVADRLHGASSPPTDRGHFISSILVAIAILFFGMIAVLYLNLTYNSGKVPGLMGGIGSENENTLPREDSVTYGTPISEPSPVPSIDTLSTLSSNYPICGYDGVDPLTCIQPEHLKTARTLYSTLKEELVLRAKWKPCSYNTEDHVPLSVAKSLLYHLSDKKKTEIDDCFNDMLILCVENPNWGLKIEKDGSTEVLSPRELLELEFTTAKISATNITPSFYCNLLGHLQVVFTYIVLISVVALIIFIAYKGVTRYQRRKKDEANEVFIYVDNILQMLQEQFELAKETGGDSFLAVSHIRDSLVPAKERLSKTALWNKVVDHISNNESRVREEIQHISGEEFRVWRWLPNASPVVSPRSRLSMMMMTPGSSPTTTPSSTPPGGASCSSNSARPPIGTPCPGPPSSSTSKWQGQAFELSDGSPNALPITPTNCLKIRHMFDSDATDDEREVRIQRAILEKCQDSLICHIGVEHGSAEGCVYVKCATKDDARKAYLSLHGWWFDGHLLSVKFLREERYLARFPLAKLANTPLTRRY